MSSQMDVPDKLDYRTLCDAVFTKLRDEILNGTLRPGQRLQQTELAARFGISRMPVRDALRKLEAEGLVTVYPERGAVVAMLDLDEFQEVYRIREVLEGLAAGLAAPNVRDEQMIVLVELVERMEEASRNNDLATWLQLDAQFHNLTYQASNSPRLLKLIASFWHTTHHFRRAYCSLPGRIQRAEEMHRRILQALSLRDGELFSCLIREHLQESVRGILEVQPIGFGPVVTSAQWPNP